MKFNTKQEADNWYSLFNKLLSSALQHGKYDHLSQLVSETVRAADLAIQLLRTKIVPGPTEVEAPMPTDADYSEPEGEG